MRTHVKKIITACVAAAVLTLIAACDEKTADDARTQGLIAQALAAATHAGDGFTSIISAYSYGSNYPGTDNGNCWFGLCTKGNYNQGFKKGLCESGKTPGFGAIFYKGHYTYMGVKWGKSGTNQDHQGVCVSKHGADKGKRPAPALRIFHDGCTGYPGGKPRRMTKGPNKGWKAKNWGRVFHGACVVHDLCYKAEPAFSGKSKGYCDNQMYKHAVEICRASYGLRGGFGPLRKNDLRKCLGKATTARAGLLIGSKNHYKAYNYKFDWRPSHVCGRGMKYDVNRKTCVSTTSSSGSGSSGSSSGGSSRPDSSSQFSVR